MINNLLQQALLHLKREKFIDPFSDYGFKRIFGTESSKDVLMEFLNSLIPEARIKDLTLLDVEQNGPMKGTTKAAVDMVCKTADDVYILIEMRNIRQMNYSKGIWKEAELESAGIIEWAPASWLSEMKRIYVIRFLGFSMFTEYTEKYRWDVFRMDNEYHQILGDSFHEIYLELPKFQLTLSHCKTLFERLLYVLKHMEVLDDMPQELNNQLFMRVKEMASIPNLTADQMIAYYRCMLDDCAYYDSLQTSMEEGREEGRIEGREEGREEGRIEGKMEGKMEVARTMKENGVDPSLISTCCGLSLSEIERL